MSSMNSVPKVDAETLLSILRSADPSDPILLIGDHGIGKSQIIAQFAEEIGATLIDRRLSQDEVADLIGMPDISTDESGNKRTVWATPDWYPDDKDKKYVLFLDELNRADRQVLQAVFELILDRRMHGKDLPPQCYVISAINAGEQYDVNIFDPALIDRFMVFKFDPKVNEWIDWAENNNVHKAITDFIALHRDSLEMKSNPEDHEMGLVRNPSRRSWTKLSPKIDMTNLSLTINFACSLLGTKIGNAFGSFIKTNSDKYNLESNGITIHDLLNKNKKEVEDWCKENKKDPSKIINRALYIVNALTDIHIDNEIVKHEYIENISFWIKNSEIPTEITTTIVKTMDLESRDNANKKYKAFFNAMAGE